MVEIKLRMCYNNKGKYTKGGKNMLNKNKNFEINPFVLGFLIK